MKKQKTRKLRVGLIKFVPKKWSLAYNWTIFEKLAVRAADQGARLICTSECILDGYAAAAKTGWTKKRFKEISQSLDGNNYLARAKELAKNLSVHIIFGFTELAEKGSYNSAALIDDKGTLLGCYRKTHLVACDERFLPGNDLPVWNTSIGKIGILICNDRWWPEAARTLLLRGAELLVVPMYGSWGLENEWGMRTRTVENEFFLCLADPRAAFICAPEGKLAAKLQNNIPSVLVHDIDLSQVKNFRMKYRRPDIYKL